MLRLDDRWVWDFWFAHDDGLTHVFYLHAPRSLGDPERRHRNARLGHAVSSDLVSWEILPDPLPIGPAGAWDDLATWTGSVIRGPDGVWNLFYTGCSTRDDGLVQRIGLATSRDLLHWERYGEAPLIEADPRWYELLDLDSWHDQAWRDPWVMEDPDGNGYHALITARARSGDPAGRGVIAHAVSPDLRSWEVRPPFESPAGFGQLEVPQVVMADGHPILAFCAGAGDVAPSRRARLPGPPSLGTYLCRVPGLLGPFRIPETTVLEPFSDRYAGKLVRHAGSWRFIGFVGFMDGAFVGALDDPIPFDPAAAALPSADGVPVSRV